MQKPYADANHRFVTRRRSFISKPNINSQTVLQIRIRDRFFSDSGFPTHISESLVKFLGVKNTLIFFINFYFPPPLCCCFWIRDPGWKKNQDPGITSRIRNTANKHLPIPMYLHPGVVAAAAVVSALVSCCTALLTGCGGEEGGGRGGRSATDGTSARRPFRLALGGINKPNCGREGLFLSDENFVVDLN